MPSYIDFFRVVAGGDAKFYTERITALLGQNKRPLGHCTGAV